MPSTRGSLSLTGLLTREKKRQYAYLKQVDDDLKADATNLRYTLRKDNEWS
jgi:hypothetical protein